jgi:hypothetical protein
MKTPSAPAASAPADRAKKLERHRRTKHNLPLWLMQPNEQQAIARGRTLMVLSVLSGVKSVKEVIEEQKVSRVLYYQLEDRALNGMLKALSPRVKGGSSDHQELLAARAQIRDLTQRVKHLTQRKRSAERLLRLLIKSNRTRVTTRRRGRPPKILSMTTMPGGD